MNIIAKTPLFSFLKAFLILLFYRLEPHTLFDREIYAKCACLFIHQHVYLKAVVFSSLKNQKIGPFSYWW